MSEAYHYPGTNPDAPGAPAPVLPAALPGSGGQGVEEFFDAPASSGSLKYRVLATSVHTDIGNGTLIVAIPLTDVISTLHRLVFLMLGVGVVVLLAIAALDYGACVPDCGRWRRWARPPGRSRPAT